MKQGSWILMKMGWKPIYCKNQRKLRKTCNMRYVSKLFNENRQNPRTFLMTFMKIKPLWPNLKKIHFLCPSLIFQAARSQNGPGAKKNASPQCAFSPRVCTSIFVYQEFWHPVLWASRTLKSTGPLGCPRISHNKQQKPEYVMMSCDESW